jgi:CheY-like chemotaxis protein
MGGKLLVQSTLGEGSTFSFTLPFKQTVAALSIGYRANGNTPRNPPRLAGLTNIFVSSEPLELSSERLISSRKRTALLHRTTGDHPARILVVDDAPINCKLLTRGFLASAKRLGIAPPVVVSASDGQVAVNFVAASLTSSKVDAEKGESSHSARFDLICMDRQMPRMCGVEAARQIKVLQSTFFAAFSSQAPTPAYVVGMSASIENATEWLEAGVDEMLNKPFLASDIDQLLLAICSRASTTASGRKQASPSARTSISDDPSTPTLPSSTTLTHE